MNLLTKDYFMMYSVWSLEDISLHGNSIPILKKTAFLRNIIRFVRLNLLHQDIYMEYIFISPPIWLEIERKYTNKLRYTYYSFKNKIVLRLKNIN